MSQRNEINGPYNRNCFVPSNGDSPRVREVGGCRTPRYLYCAHEVILARKRAKTRRHTGLRSKTTKSRTHVDRLRAANADLKKKLAEVREQQTATSEVLRIISGSPGELEPVFDTMLANATRICEANFANLY